MDQPRALQDVGDIFFHLQSEAGISAELQDIFTDILTKRFAQGGYFQRMGQPRPDKVALIEREYLRLILEAPERRASDDPVVILLKLAPQI